MKNIAFIVSQFDKSLFGGGEIHAKLMAYHNKDKYKITILTTKSIDHKTWSNAIVSNSEIQDGLQILRFSVDHPRHTFYFNQLTNKILQNPKHTKEQELKWIKSYGPYSSAFLQYLSDHRRYYDAFIFFGYSHSLTYFGLPIVKSKAILIPFAHQETALQFKIYDKVFSTPAIIAPSTNAEINIIKERFSDLPPLYKLGVGVDKKPKSKNYLKRLKFKIPYVLYIGRIEKNKGVIELSDYFSNYKEKFNKNLHLVFVGKQYHPLPRKKYFHYLGLVSDQDKYDLIKNAELLINPSPYESLSLTLLEAWQQSIPVLVNGLSKVLRSQVLEANGGLYYENSDEFASTLDWFINHPREKNILGKQGNLYADQNYSWKIINSKFESLLNFL